jgi:hypothetical protein
VDAGVYLQSFLVAAVAAILVTRFYLRVTGFPQVGGGQLHIAHLLWGGLLMLVAMVLLLAVIGKRAKRVGALVGGLGFGLFLDELGKFITRENDYFFQPTIALIYVVFIVLFLAFRSIERRSFSSHELLANATDQVRELILGGATEAEVARALSLLQRSGVHDALTEGIRQAIAGTVCVTQESDAMLSSTLVKTQARLWRLYDALIAWRWFHRMVETVFLLEGSLSVLVALAIGLGTLMGQFAPDTYFGSQSSAHLGLLLSAIASLSLVVLGVVYLPRSRLTAYRWFERSILVSVFFTQVLMFWQAQLAALSGLALDLVLLAGLRYMLRQEEARRVEVQVSGLEPVYSSR